MTIDSKLKGSWEAVFGHLGTPDEVGNEWLALAADAERYRFLRQDFSPIGLNIDGNHAWAYRRNATLKGPNLDAAIDAAMEKS